MTQMAGPCRGRLVQRWAGKGNRPLPLQPHPQNQPNPTGEGTTLKPDISLATKTGHFNLLPTGLRWSRQVIKQSGQGTTPSISLHYRNDSASPTIYTSHSADLFLLLLR